MSGLIRIRDNTKMFWMIAVAGFSHVTNFGEYCPITVRETPHVVVKRHISIVVLRKVEK